MDYEAFLAFVKNELGVTGTLKYARDGVGIFDSNVYKVALAKEEIANMVVTTELPVASGDMASGGFFKCYWVSQSGISFVGTFKYDPAKSILYYAGSQISGCELRKNGNWYGAFKGEDLKVLFYVP